MKRIRLFLLLLLSLFILNSQSFAWTTLYVRGDFNSWASNAMYKQIGGVNDLWTLPWRGTTNGIALGDINYLEYKFDPDGAWGGDSYGANDIDYGTNSFAVINSGGSEPNIKKTNIQLGHPYIFSFNKTLSTASCELITNIALCGTNFLQINQTSITLVDWTSSNQNNLMLQTSATEWKKFVGVTNILSLKQFKFVPNKSWTSKAGVGWSYGNNNFSPLIITNEGERTSFTIDNGGINNNLFWVAYDKGIYNIYFNAITGQYRIKLSGGSGIANLNKDYVNTSQSGITLTNFITAGSNEIKHIAIVIPDTWGGSFTALASAGTVYISGHTITVSNININKGTTSYVVLENLTSPSSTELSIFTNKTASTNSDVSSLWNIMSGAPAIIVDTPPVLTNASASSTLTFGSNNLSVKLQKEKSFTLDCTYKDVEGDKPGYPGFGTNFILVNIYTNYEYYGSIAVATNSGTTIDYVAGYEFSFTTTGTSQIQFTYQGLYWITNSFASLCSNYIVNYSWEARELGYYTNMVHYFSFTNWLPQILVDDNPPDIPANVMVKSNEALGNALQVIYNKVTNSDLSHYIVEYGTNKTVNLVQTNVGFNTNVLLYPLLSSTKYYVKVYSYDDIGNYANTTFYSNTTLNAKPTLSNPVTKAKVTFGLENMSFKEKSVSTITLAITYKDIENDKPGYPDVTTNSIFINVYTNNEYYGAFVVLTNSTPDYTTGYTFTFTTCLTDDLIFHTSLTQFTTNSFKNLCLSYTNVSYHWSARAITGNTNGWTTYPMTNKPLIIIDDTPPNTVDTTITVSADSVVIKWDASTSDDLATLPYYLEWGETENYGNSSGLLGQSTLQYTITSLKSGTKYYYRLLIYDEVGNYTEVKGEFTTGGGVSVEEIGNILSSLNLPSNINADNVAAAINDKTAIAFPIVVDKNSDVVFTYVNKDVEKINIYSITGKLVFTIEGNNISSVGDTSIGILKYTDKLASGIYFAVYTDGDGNKTSVKFVYGIKK